MKFNKKTRAEMIGKKCIVSSIYTGKPKWVKSKIKDRPGWVVGFGVIRIGGGEYEDEYAGWIFIHKKTIKVVKVRFWPTEKEQNVPYDCFVIDENAEPFPSMAKYSEEYKKNYHAYIDSFPRDKKGRFVELYSQEGK